MNRFEEPPIYLAEDGQFLREMIREEPSWKKILMRIQLLSDLQKEKEEGKCLENQQENH